MIPEAVGLFYFATLQRSSQQHRCTAVQQSPQSSAAVSAAYQLVQYTAVLPVQRSGVLECTGIRVPNCSTLPRTKH